MLNAVFPEQEEIECLVIRDFYHRYTVDEHTLMTIRTLLSLHKDIPAGAKPYAELLSELENPVTLYFALLYHDVGKGTPEEGHVDVSLRLCEVAMERIGMPGPDREMVRFLIGKHLALSGGNGTIADASIQMVVSADATATDTTTQAAGTATDAPSAAND